MSNDGQPERAPGTASFSVYIKLFAKIRIMMYKYE